MAHRLSIVTPSYNQGRFIERTIESVLSQQFPGSLEYLVMDGGSTDETVDILRRHEATLSWVSEKDGGQADAVNKGLSRSTGEIIGWLNSDDIYYPGAFLAACEAFDSDPALDVIYGDANHIDEDDRVIEPYPTEEVDFARLVNTCYICQPAVFFRKSVVDRFGPLDANLQYCLDYEYWVRLTAAGAKFRRVRCVLAGSRLYRQNKTLGSRVLVHTEINDMLRRHAGRVPDRWLFNYAHAVLDERGIPRSDRVRFPLRVGMLSLRSALRWNRRISISMAKTACLWVGASMSELWKRTAGSR
jgi:glycosyltransferase involved in cell wall biosynthesis